MAWGQTVAQKPSPSQPDVGSALEFLGSYTAPSAILSTETSHTSARPPTPPASGRLRRIELGFALFPPWPRDFAWSPASVEKQCGGASAPAGANPPAAQATKPASGAAQPQAGSLHGELTRADEALQAAQIHQAVAAYERVLEARPACSAAGWNLALAEAYARSPAALGDLTTALHHAPSLALARVMMALARLANGDLTGARAELAAVSIQPFPSGHRSHPGSALAELTTAGSVKTRDHLWVQAMVSEASGEFTVARKLLVRLSALEPGSDAVWFELGGVALEEAREISRRLAEVAPQSTWNRRLEAGAVAVRYPRLAQTLRPSGAEALRTAPAPGGPSDTGTAESPRALYLRARAALRLSESAYRRASRSPRFAAYLHALRALAAEQENDEAAALREYQAGLAQDPASAILHAGLGHLYRNRLDLPAARRELARAWELDSTDPIVAFELGDVDLRLGGPEQALPLLNQALQLEPDLLLARWSRAKAYLALGDKDRALADFEAAAPADHSGELQWQLARLYRQLGRDDLAAQAQKRSEEERKRSQQLTVKSSQ